MDRDEQRRCLRQKIAARRQQRVGHGGASSVSAALQNDPMSALMGMGVSDPSVLAQATQLAKNPDVLRQTFRAMKSAGKDRSSRANKEVFASERENDEEEEAPPPPQRPCVEPSHGVLDEYGSDEEDLPPVPPMSAPPTSPRDAR